MPAWGLLCDSYVDLAQQDVDVLINYYLTQVKSQHLVSLVRDEFDSIFAIQTVQRCLKACGSFASFFNTRGDTRYLKYVKPTLARVNRVLKEMPEFKELHGLLMDFGLFEPDIPIP
jgi:N-acetylmuramate 1-kinase